jgi:putative endonuclease
MLSSEVLGAISQYPESRRRKLKQSEWVVYILNCADGSFYTGVTTDVARRIRQHNGEIVGGARYTRVRRPVAIAWQQACDSRSQACQYEAQIKALSRSAKERLITSKALWRPAG